MAIFKYKASTSEHKTLSGLVEADNTIIAQELLRDKGLDVISLEEQAQSGASKGLSIVGRVTIKDMVVFTRQFAVLVSANVAMVQALKVLVEQTENIKLKMVLSEISDEVEGGAKLSDVLDKHDKVFSQFYINIVRSGETSGRLDEVLIYLADEMEKDYDMMSKIKNAMIYPAFVLTGLLGVGVFMMIFVVPKLTDVLASSGGELPIATKILIGTSNFLSTYWFLVLLIFIGLVAGAVFSLKTVAGRMLTDRALLSLPVFGKMFRMIYITRFARTMNTLIAGGVTMTKGLKISADVVGNHVYKDLIMQTVKEVEDGNSIADVFSHSREVPKMVSQMLVIGEKTGRLEMVLGKIAEFYGREVNNMVANLMTLMEPIIMVVMGIGVGIMVAAIILPMYNMATTM